MSNFFGEIFSGDTYSKKISFGEKEDGPGIVQGGYYLFLPSSRQEGKICLKWATINGVYECMYRDKFIEKVGDKIFSKKKLIEFEDLPKEIKDFYLQNQMIEDEWLDNHLVLSRKVTKMLKNKFGDYKLSLEYPLAIKSAFPYLSPKVERQLCYCIIDGIYVVRAWQCETGECGFDDVPLEDIIIGQNASYPVIQKHCDITNMPKKLVEVVFYQSKVESTMSNILHGLKVARNLEELEPDVYRALHSGVEEYTKNAIAQIIGDTFYALKVPTLNIYEMFVIANYFLDKEML